MNQKSLFLAHFFGPNGLTLGCHNYLVQVGGPTIRQFFHPFTQNGPDCPSLPFRASTWALFFKMPKMYKSSNLVRLVTNIHRKVIMITYYRYRLILKKFLCQTNIC